MPRHSQIIILSLLVIFACIPMSCKEKAMPKPRGYFRINFPEKYYTKVDWKRNTLVVGPNAYNGLEEHYRFEEPITKKVKGEEFIGYPFDTRDFWGD